MDKPKSNNPQVSMGLHERILFSTISSWLLGEESNVKIIGSQLQIETFARTLGALREFHEELRKPDVDLGSVKKKLGIKNAYVKEFEKVFRMKWPSQL
jgi:hypothetical protein